MMEIRLRLDDNVDKDVVSAIKKIADDGPVSKALYRIVLEWRFLQQYGFVPKTGEFATDPGELPDNSGQSENNLDDALSAIDEAFE
jgi:hypothetical protein